MITIITYTSHLNASDNIQLPDILILGEADKLPDTISLDKLLQQYWQNTDLSQFQYKPFISFEPVKSYQEDSIDNYKLISLNLGNKYYSDLRGVFLSATNPLHRYSAAIGTDRIIPDRQTFKSRLTWSPYFISSLESDNGRGNYTSLITEIQYNTFQAEQGEYTNEFNHLSFGISVAHQANLLLFRNTDLSLTFNRFQQNLLDGDEQSFNDFDFLLGSTLSLQKNDLEFAHLPLELNFFRGKPALSLSLIKNKLFFLDNVGVTILADEEDILPSFNLSFDQKLNRYLSVHLHNKPELEKKNRYFFLNDNPDQDIDIDIQPTKTYINSSFGLSSTWLLPLSVSYALKMHKDYHYYTQQDSLFLTQDKDLFEQNIELAVAYHLRRLMFTLSSRYTVTDEFVPFLPYWQTTLIAGWKSESYRIWSELLYLTERKDIDEEVMDDSLLLSLHFQKRITRKLTANLALRNILDQPYRKYQLDESLSLHQIPREIFRLQAGVSYTF